LNSAPLLFIAFFSVIAPQVKVPAAVPADADKVQIAVGVQVHGPGAQVVFFPVLLIIEWARSF